ncbi:hypothetical protein AN458_06415 [Pseudomonas aeruginosa]|nr:hypothetical protein BH78_30095 [Pseudomonas aeruginosa C1913C]KHE35446.1 hypothetical protein LH31_08275 [Pseudomonas aeruginosa]KRV15205.1 hypothetical protein AN458_06415 [Pseudomonas aeruginosa]
MSFEVAYIRRIDIRPIITEPRGAGIGSPGQQGQPVELIHRGTARRHKTYSHAITDSGCIAIGRRQHDETSPRATPDRGIVLIGYVAVPQRGQYCIVESTGFFQVIGAQSDVAEHGYSTLLMVVL